MNADKLGAVIHRERDTGDKTNVLCSNQKRSLNHERGASDEHVLETLSVRMARQAEN